MSAFVYMAIFTLFTTIWGYMVSASAIERNATAGFSVAPELSAGQTFRDCAKCSEMVVVPAGTFTIGSPPSEKDRWINEAPQKKVSVRRFAAGRFDVTRGEWSLFVAATRRKIPQGCTWSGRTQMTSDPLASWRSLGFAQNDMHPVVCVTWRDAEDYALWLSKLTGKKYRLLSESEWEYAARAGSDTPYPWGTTATHEHANYGSDKWGGLASGGDKWVYTSPVNAFPPNAFGLYDMHGNVLQWVQDCFAPDYSALPTDGTPYLKNVLLKTTGDFAFMNGQSSCAYRMLRGGDWGDPPMMIRSAARNFVPPPAPPPATIEDYRSGGVGFRVARTLD